MTLYERPQTDAVLELREDAQDERTVRLRIMPWDVVAQTPQGPEAFARGAFDAVDPTRVVIEAGGHGGPLVGRGLALEQAEDAAYLDARIARTSAGDELLELARDGVLRDVSVVFAPVRGGSRRSRAGATIRTRADLRRVAILERGAYPGAQVVEVREEVAPMEDQTPDLTVDAIASAVRTIITEAIPTPIVAIPAPADPAPLLARAESMADLYARVLAGDDELARAMADETTADVPSIVRPAWLDRIVGIVAGNRPVANAFGVVGLPPDGMEVNWPVFDPDDETSDATRIAVQATQKTDVASAKIVLGSDKTTIQTWAGGLDIAWQVLRRSSPAFQEIALRILTASWARVTDRAFAAAIMSKGTGTGTLPDLTTGTAGQALHRALLEASAKVDDATGSPATFVLAGADAWLDIGGAAGLLPRAYGTQNLPGVAQASTLAIEVSGLPIIRAKSLPADAVVVSNGEAADLMDTGAMTATQDVIAKLGTDVVVWSMGAPAVYIPSGIVKLTATP